MEPPGNGGRFPPRSSSPSWNSHKFDDETKKLGESANETRVTVTPSEGAGGWKWPSTKDDKKPKSKKKSVMTLAHLGLAVSVNPMEQKPDNRITPEFVISSIQDEVARSKKEENTIHLEMPFPRPREQNVHHESVGDAGGDIFFSSVTRSAEGQKLTKSRDIHCDVNTAEGKKKIYDSLARAVSEGEEGKKLDRWIQKAGGIQVLQSLRIEMKGKAEKLKVNSSISAEKVTSI